MKKVMLFVLAFTQFSVAVFGQAAGSAGQGTLLRVVGPLVVIIFLVVWLEWQIGKAIGKHVSKTAGLVLGILGIVLFPFFLGGIACIVYSSKNTDVITVNIPGNADPPNPVSASGGDTRECPYCAEIIKKKATVCRFCGKEIKADSEPETAVPPRVFGIFK